MERESLRESTGEDLHTLRVTYEVNGDVIRVVEKKISEQYRWFLLGNSSWREW